MNILGIETSCDETAAAVVKNGKEIISNTIVSSLKEHSKYGGVIPEIASRKHYECINLVTEKALSDAKMSLKDIDAIAVTKEPGLIGSLLVGNSFAKSLSYANKIRLIEVNHIEAHMYGSFLYNQKETFIKNNYPKLPAIGLVASGGHTNLYLIKDFTNLKLIGKTLDDAVGESFDKVARILELGYPGGPIIDKLAASENKSDIKFTSAKLSGTFNFSFSGIKTAVLYHAKNNKNSKDFSLAKTAFSFQESVIDDIIKKSFNACIKFKINSLVIGGGVAANSRLRFKLNNEAKNLKINVFIPKMSLCTDNAAMIAGLGYHKSRKD